jgi:hypothetical protein
MLIRAHDMHNICNCTCGVFSTLLHFWFDSSIYIFIFLTNNTISEKLSGISVNRGLHTQGLKSCIIKAVSQNHNTETYHDPGYDDNPSFFQCIISDKSTLTLIQLSCFQKPRKSEPKMIYTIISSGAIFCIGPWFGLDFCQDQGLRWEVKLPCYTLAAEG